MALTDTALKAAKPRDAAYKLFDEKGLFLLVSRTGGRLWRFKYRLGGKEKLISLGAYPDVSLKAARERRDAARTLVAAGTDPSAQRRSERVARAQTFKAVATEWLEQTQEAKLAKVTYAKKKGWLDELVYPHIGEERVDRVTPDALLQVLKRIEAKGLNETTHRVRSLCSNVFRFAMASGRATTNPADVLLHALAPVVTSNRAALTFPSRIGDLMRAIEVYRGQPTTRAALKLLALTFVRPGEFRFAEWREFQLDGDSPEWRIPAARMKMREEHVVPLAAQAVETLRELESHSGSSRWLFPSLRGGHRPISENAINVALKTMGFDGTEITGHGFRAMASTCLNEQGHAPDVIELQLAHKDRNAVRAAYNRATRMAERRQLMQTWADHLDTLRSAVKAERPTQATSDASVRS
jgi:integrase